VKPEVGSPSTILSVPRRDRRHVRSITDRVPATHTGQELAPAFAMTANRLLWRHRALPSATLDKMRTKLSSMKSRLCFGPPSSPRALARIIFGTVFWGLERPGSCCHRCQGANAQGSGGLVPRRTEGLGGISPSGPRVRGAWFRGDAPSPAGEIVPFAGFAQENRQDVGGARHAG
jgi:hypothetical protein